MVKFLYGMTHVFIIIEMVHCCADVTNLAEDTEGWQFLARPPHHLPPPACLEPGRQRGKPAPATAAWETLARTLIQPFSYFVSVCLQQDELGCFCCVKIRDVS